MASAARLASVYEHVSVWVRLVQLRSVRVRAVGVVGVVVVVLCWCRRFGAVFPAAAAGGSCSYLPIRIDHQPSPPLCCSTARMSGARIPPPPSTQCRPPPIILICVYLELVWTARQDTLIHVARLSTGFITKTNRIINILTLTMIQIYFD